MAEPTFRELFQRFSLYADRGYESLTVTPAEMRVWVLAVGSSLALGMRLVTEELQGHG